MNTSDKKKESLSAVQIGLSGALTGTLTRFLVQPLDVLKIQFQLQVTPTDHKDPPKYRTVIQSLGKIAREEGLFGLWKGHIPAQYLSVVYGAVQFSTYEALVYYAPNIGSYKKTTYQHLMNISCGSLAGMTAVVISFPFDVLKTHLVFQGKPPIYKGLFDAMTQIYQKEGLRGFTRGMSASCIQNSSMSGLMFYFHGLFTQCWLLLFYKMDSTESLYLSTSGSLITGLFAGLCAKTVVYPFDLIKKRLQIQSYDDTKSCTKVMIKCNGVIQCFKLTVRSEGFLGLFKGLNPSILKAGATTSLYFTIYDKICQFFQYINV